MDAFKGRHVILILLILQYSCFSADIYELTQFAVFRSQTTKGIWLARCAGIEPCTLVMDLEGTDGRERGEVPFLRYLLNKFNNFKLLQSRNESYCYPHKQFCLIIVWLNLLNHCSCKAHISTSVLSSMMVIFAFCLSAHAM